VDSKADNITEIITDINSTKICSCSVHNMALQKILSTDDAVQLRPLMDDSALYFCATANEWYSVRTGFTNLSPTKKQEDQQNK